MILLEVKDQELQVEVLLVGQDFPELDPLVDGILNPTLIQRNFLEQYLVINRFEPVNLVTIPLIFQMLTNSQVNTK